MKSKKAASLCKLLLICSAGLVICDSAFAQSTVTIYGILDSGLEYLNHVSTQGSGVLTGETSGSRIPSRWGFTGSENLGGGLRAIFTLESGFSINSGELQYNDRLFGRQSFVGLASDTYGSLTMGRQMTPAYRELLSLLPSNYSTYGLPAQDLQFSGHADNSVGYQNHVGPFELQTLYSFGYDATVVNGSEVPGEWRVGKEFDIGAGYHSNAVNLVFSYEQRQGQTYGSSGNSERRFVAAGTLQIGQAKVYGGYELLLNNVSATLQASPPQTMVFGGLVYKVTPEIQLLEATYYHSYRSVSAHALSTGLQVDYLLSKRTSLYSDVTYVTNSAQAALGAIATSTVVKGDNQLLITVGIVHRF